jgi:hypothetical protein
MQAARNPGDLTDAVQGAEPEASPQRRDPTETSLSLKPAIESCVPLFFRYRIKPLPPELSNLRLRIMRVSPRAHLVLCGNPGVQILPNTSRTTPVIAGIDTFSASMVVEQFDVGFVIGSGLMAGYCGLPGTGVAVRPEAVDLPGRFPVVAPEAEIDVRLPDSAFVVDSAHHLELPGTPWPTPDNPSWKRGYFSNQKPLLDVCAGGEEDSGCPH